MQVKLAVKEGYNHDSIVTPLIAKKPQNAISTESEETTSMHKQMMSANKVTSDNFDNVELHVRSHNLAEYCIKFITLNCVNGTNIM